MPDPSMGPDQGPDQQQEAPISAPPGTPPTGSSLSYHIFTDTDTDAGAILNPAAPVVLHQSEDAHGLGWTLTDDWTGGNVTVSALGRYTQKTDPALTDLAGFLLTGTQVRLDFPAEVARPVGEWLFYATLTKGELEDVTSAILVTILPDLA